MPAAAHLPRGPVRMRTPVSEDDDDDEPDFLDDEDEEDDPDFLDELELDDEEDDSPGMRPPKLGRAYELDLTDRAPLVFCVVTLDAADTFCFPPAAGAGLAD